MSSTVCDCVLMCVSVSRGMWQCLCVSWGMWQCVCVSRGMWHGPGFIRKLLRLGFKGENRSWHVTAPASGSFLLHRPTHCLHVVGVVFFIFTLIVLYRFYDCFVASVYLFCKMLSIRAVPVQYLSTQQVPKPVFGDAYWKEWCTYQYTHGQCIARPRVIFPAAEYHCRFTGTKL